MNPIVTRVRTPVRRQGADTFLLVTLLSFAASVAVTRLFLTLTGYPQIGGGGIHIAHVLWGGLLLFVAALLPLIYANRWVYTVDAVLAGAGIGLFIDEVGKFITQANDYFYPGAAPIIYAFFLLTVLLYLQIRRPPSLDPRAELYRALEGLEEVLDRDLEAHEQAELETHLNAVIQRSRQPELSRMASELLDFLATASVTLAPAAPSFWERLAALVKAGEERWFGRRRLRVLVGIGLALVGVLAVLNLGLMVSFSLLPRWLQQLASGWVIDARVASTGGAAWFSARTALEAAVGVLLLLAAVLLAAGKEKQALGLGYLGLLLSLTAVNLVVFYFDQFSTIAVAALQFAVLLGVIRYRGRFLPR
jgi:hypothetical protein